MIRFIEVVNDTNFNPRMERVAIPEYSLGEVWINEKYVVNIREATGYTQMLREGRLPQELDAMHRFTAITVNEGNRSHTHIVVGEMANVANRLSKHKGQLLKG